MNDIDNMIKAIADNLGKMGVDGFEFVDEHGNVKASYQTNPPKEPTQPLRGYGDQVSVGNTVVIAIYENGQWKVDFGGRPVKILNYDLDLSDPFLLVEDEGKKVSLNYVGAGWQRYFKVI